MNCDWRLGVIPGLRPRTPVPLWNNKYVELNRYGHDVSRTGRQTSRQAERLTSWNAPLVIILIYQFFTPKIIQFIRPILRTKLTMSLSNNNSMTKPWRVPITRDFRSMQKGPDENRDVYKHIARPLWMQDNDHYCTYRSGLCLEPNIDRRRTHKIWCCLTLDSYFAQGAWPWGIVITEKRHSVRPAPMAKW